MPKPHRILAVITAFVALGALFPAVTLAQSASESATPTSTATASPSPSASATPSPTSNAAAISTPKPSASPSPSPTMNPNTPANTSVYRTIADLPPDNYPLPAFTLDLKGGQSGSQSDGSHFVRNFIILLAIVAGVVLGVLYKKGKLNKYLKRKPKSRWQALNDTKLPPSTPY